ncbi:hypothetical protein BT69DRAFT_1233058 [Atractiella rhizophila]|nr:hypothetical protein BT69DRAFT_1233058 [Atractiella rhizophila]
MSLPPHALPTSTNDARQPRQHYLTPYTDFYGTPSVAPCANKSDPAWFEPTGDHTTLQVHKLRPVYDHPFHCQLLTCIG